MLLLKEISCDMTDWISFFSLHTSPELEEEVHVHMLVLGESAYKSKSELVIFPKNFIELFVCINKDKGKLFAFDFKENQYYTP